MNHTLTKQTIERKLQAALNPTELLVIDESHKHAGHAGAQERGGGHFKVHITSANFTGKSRIQCHQLVQTTVSEEFAAGLIHALSIRVA